MKKDDCKWSVDYDIKTLFYPDSLTTKINEVSAMIHRSTLRGGANVLVFHPKMLPRFEKMEYFNNESQTMCGRYTSIIDDSIEENVVYVYNKNVNEEEKKKFKKKLYGYVQVIGQIPE